MHRRRDQRHRSRPGSHTGSPRRPDHRRVTPDWSGTGLSPRRRPGSRPGARTHVVVAEWRRHRPTKAAIAGSTPADDTTHHPAVVQRSRHRVLNPGDRGSTPRRGTDARSSNGQDSRLLPGRWRFEPSSGSSRGRRPTAQDLRPPHGGCGFDPRRPHHTPARCAGRGILRLLRGRPGRVAPSSARSPGRDHPTPNARGPGSVGLHAPHPRVRLPLSRPRNRRPRAGSSC